MKSHIRALCAVLFAITVSACSAMPDFEAEECKSVDDVRANIEQFNGSEVSVCGFLKYGFEDKNLYHSPDAAKQYSDRQCLSIGIREGAVVDLSASSDRWVRINGFATAEFCPKDTICSSSCSKEGVFVKSVTPLQ